MALLFVDGCSHYATDDILKKWSANVGMTITASDPRRPGTKSITAPTGYSWKVTSPIFPSTEYLVCGFAMRSGYPYFLVRFLKGSTIQAGLTLSSNVLSVQREYTNVAFMDVTSLIAQNEWYYFEFATRIHDTLGSCEVRLNGIPLPALILNGIDMKPGADTGIDRVEFWCGAQFTDIYLDTTTFHGDCIVETLYPTAAGYHAAWVPSAGANFENVDDLGDIDEDSTYNASPVQGAKDSFETGNLLSRPASAVKGVALHLTARKDWAGGRVVKPMLRVGGSDYLPSTEGLNLSEVYHGKQDIWELNPATGAAWSESGVNGAEIGYDLVTAT